VRKTFRRGLDMPVHYVPTAEDNVAAIRAGLGWGMFAESLPAKQLVRCADGFLDVPLYWQCSKLDTGVVGRITDAVKSAAGRLRP